MATKATASRPAAKKRTSAKTTKSSTATRAKKPAAKSRSAKKSDYTSFQLADDKQQFMSFSVTRQTIYWAVLGVLAILFSWYTISMTQQINDIYSQIDEIRVSESLVDTAAAQESAQASEEPTE